MNLIEKLIIEEQGQGLVEYGLIVGLIALVCVVAMTSVGSNINTIWTKISTKLSSAASTATTS